MAARSSNRKRPQRGKTSAVPWWVFVSLVILLLALAWLRCRLTSESEEPSPDTTRVTVQDPPSFPETPATERLPLPEEPGEGAVQEPDAETAGLMALPEPTGGPPRIALVLDDVGYRMDLVKEAERVLPRTVTFAVIPFLPYSKEAADSLHRCGFPVILHQPMEPIENHRWKQTSHTLLVGMPREEVAAILERCLEAVPQAEGVNNHMGSRATSDPESMAHVMAYLATRDLYFLDSRTTARTVAYQMARRHGVAAAQRAVFLDDTDEVRAIMKQIDATGARALKEGDVVGLGHIRANTLRALAERIPYWRSQGVEFIPLREMVR